MKHMPRARTVPSQPSTEHREDATMVAPAVAPYVPTYASESPYITAAEYLAEPTGVDTSKLVPSGSVQDNTAALTRMCAHGSSWVDSICHQILAATTDVQAGIYRMRSDGTVWVPVAYSPIIAVTDVKWGWQPGAANLTDMPDLSTLWIDRKVVQVPLLSATPGGPQVPLAASGFYPDRVYVQLTYINGYANTTLTAAPAQGATSLTVASPLGIAAGLPMAIYDGAAAENVTISPAYVFGAAPIPLASGLTYAHLVGASLSALPPQVKQATVSLTSALIKTRGAQALVMPSISSRPSKRELIASGGLADVEVATSLLGDFIRVR
jgi:hypothetical protein